MSAITRPLAADLLPLALEEEVEKLTTSEALGRSGRSARALVKDGPMRVILVALAPGADIAPHAVDGPALIQPLRGEIALRVGSGRLPLGPGELLSIGPRVQHSVESPRGGVFLVMVTTEGELPNLEEGR